jgi:hypothetical protein
MISNVGICNQKKDKVLFVGNNDESTDQQVSILAKEHDTVNHGLIIDSVFVPDQPGLYHTTVVDIPWGNLISLALNFDLIVMLDQPQAQWSHWKCMQATFKLMVKLEQMGCNTVFRGNKNIKKILYWSNLLYEENKSFCIYPWINFSDIGNRLTLCSRDTTGITDKNNFTNWKTVVNTTLVSPGNNSDFYIDLKVSKFAQILKLF